MKICNLRQARNQMACLLSDLFRYRETNFSFALNPDGTFKKYLRGMEEIPKGWGGFTVDNTNNDWWVAVSKHPK